MPEKDFPKIHPWVPAPPDKKHRKLFRFASRGALTPLFFFLDPTEIGDSSLEDNDVIKRYHKKTGKKKKKNPSPSRKNQEWGQDQFISGWKNYKKNTFG